MGKESELLRLEKHIERLLGGYTKLQAENRRLAQELEQQHKETQRLEQKLNSLDSERGDVYQRVSSLIGRIERWETERSKELSSDDQDDEPEDDEHREFYQAPEELELNAESSDSQEQREEDRSGGVQGSLFTR